MIAQMILQLWNPCKRDKHAIKHNHFSQNVICRQQNLISVNSKVIIVPV